MEGNKTPEQWMSLMRKNKAQHDAKPPLTDRQRAEIAAKGWEEEGFAAHVDPETNEVYGYEKRPEPAPDSTDRAPLSRAALGTITEKKISELHKRYSLYRGNQFANMPFYKEVRHDVDAERADFLKMVGALSPAERKMRLRKVIYPWVWEIYDRLGITEILMNSELGSDVVSQMTERLKLAEHVIREPEFIKKDKNRRREFKYWLFLKRLHEPKR